MKPPLWLAALGMLGTLAMPRVAAADEPRSEPRSEPKITYDSFTLANGLHVFVIEDHKAPIINEVLWFNVGSKDEQPRRTGFAHLFEHLMFKGSAHIADGQMDQLLEEAGGWSNAFTSSDMTVYQNVAASNFLEAVLWGEGDRVAGLMDTFDQSKLANQRDVVLNERRQSYENRPYGMSELLILDALWPASFGYHWSTIGYTSDLKAAVVPDVQAFFIKYYVPNNATLVLAGDVTAAQARPLVEKYLGFIPAAPVPARPQYTAPPPITKEVVLTATDDVQVPKVFLAWRGPAKYSADEPALDLAMMVLGSGKSSRLYKRLVYDDKIAQDAEGASYGEMLAGTAQIEITAKPGTASAALVKAATEEIAKLAATGPTAAELERVQASHESGFLYGLEATLQKAITLAGYDVQAKDPAYFAKDIARYRAVTAAQIKAAAAAYLKTTARVQLTIKPGPKQKETK